MLEIRLFGAGTARYNDRPLPFFPGQQPGLILCYLLLNRHRSLSREQIASVFWGDHLTTVSRKMLRNALWRLHQALADVGARFDDYLRHDDERVSIVTTRECWLDVEVFETAAAGCKGIAEPALTDLQAMQLAQAHALYTGDLLEDIYEDWCLYDRERLRLMHLDILKKLMVYSGLHGQYEQALRFGEQVLKQDATREAVHRHIIWLYWKAGDRCAAIAQYKRCVQILREELGVAPMPQTTRLYQAMLHRPSHSALALDQTLAEQLFSASPTEARSPQAIEALQSLQHLTELLESSSAELRRLQCLLAATLQGPGEP